MYLLVCCAACVGTMIDYMREWRVCRYPKSAKTTSDLTALFAIEAPPVWEAGTNDL